MRIANLAEAEGRLLRKAGARLGLSLALMVVAAILLLIGSIALLTGVWFGLEATMHRGWAAGLTGLLAFAFAGVILWAASRMNK